MKNHKKNNISKDLQQICCLCVTLRLVLLPEKASLCKLSVSIHIIFVLHIFACESELSLCYTSGNSIVLLLAITVILSWHRRSSDRNDLQKSSIKYIIFTMIVCRLKFSRIFCKKARNTFSCAAKSVIFSQRVAHVETSLMV